MIRSLEGKILERSEKTMKKYLLLFSVILLFANCSIEPASFKSVTNPSIENLSSAPTFKMNVNLFNPNNFGFKLKSYRLHVSVDSVHIATDSQDLAMRIPAD